MPTGLYGVGRGQMNFMESTRKIFDGKNLVFEYFLNREERHATFRLEISRSILAPGAYLVEKNLPYTTRFPEHYVGNWIRLSTRKLCLANPVVARQHAKEK